MNATNPTLPKSTTVLANGAEIHKNIGSWSGVCNYRTSKPYAIKFQGSMLRTAKGAIRTFKTREAARKVAETLEAK